MEEAIVNAMRRLAEIIAGIPLNYQEIPDNKKEQAILIALHCCFNGPVGVGKQTTFPVVGPGKIKDLLGCTNSSWKGFCLQVAQLATKINPDVDCSRKRLGGKYWPL